MDSVISYIKSNINSYVNELLDYIRIPSISTLESHKNEMQRCAEFISNKIKNAGMNRVEIFQTEGHPIVYGEWLEAPGKPTVLIYGHYDVQPVDPLELWNNPPFEPVIKDGKIWARGANDDKGQAFVHVKSVEAFFKTKGKLPLNVKFILEGEVLAIDAEGNHLPFQTLMQRRRKYDVEEYIKKIPVRLKCFDLLYLNGKSVMNENYLQRSEELSKIVQKGKNLTLTKLS